MSKRADICLFLEGSYPYVTGGVAGWTHEMILHQPELTFHIVTILPRDEEPTLRYELPKNVTGLTQVRLMRLPEGNALPQNKLYDLIGQLKEPFTRLTTGKANLTHWRKIVETLAPYRGIIGSEALLNNPEAWQLVTDMYEASFSESSMLDYFWSWRALFGGLFSVLLADLPQAKVYHAMSTGYAGMMAARASLETKRPFILTEHGIYTNERRIEIASADWLEETASKLLTIDRTRLNLRDLWIDSFANYSRIAYQAANHIVTLFEGNQTAQLHDGAALEKMSVIHNGVDVERYAALPRRPHDRQTVALIGRIVPIKDVKSFIRAVALLRGQLPDIRALILGPSAEDPDYFAECQSMVDYYALSEHITFTGMVKIEDYLPEIDVIAFSSISEAQPLVILEAGAAGIPIVATDVGACREMVLGKADETPAFGPGGIIVPLSNPAALAEAILKLFQDRTFHDQCAIAMKARVMKDYNKEDQYRAYRTLYADCMED